MHTAHSSSRQGDLHQAPPPREQAPPGTRPQEQATPPAAGTPQEQAPPGAGTPGPDPPPCEQNHRHL